MVLSMPHTKLEDVVNIINEQNHVFSNNENVTGENIKPFSIHSSAFDTVEASCKYDVYLKKQEDEMKR